MRRIIFTLVLSALTMCASAQLYHAKGNMGVGFRGGFGYNGYDLGLMYDYHLSDKVGLMLELDREKAEFTYTDFSNMFLLGLGADYAVWHPATWLYMHIGATGNIGYDVWDCKVMDWTEKHAVYGLSGGLDFEAYATQWLSFVLKARQWMLWGGGDSYVKPDFSLGVKVNW
ncbi:MAG: conjugal transfer protein TraO [Bacilli bacterium]|nr:conjugal transfer protein TraO [Bacilli bacterium]